MQIFWQSLRLFILLTLLLGVLYPIGITTIAQVIAARRSTGELLSKGDTIVGARLIGQNFTSDKYFWGRPSASNNDALASGGTNLGPTSKMLQELVQERKKKNGSDSVPSELVYASGSGLDPHISVATAMFQVERIIKARNLGPEGKERIYKVIEKNVIGRQLGFLGNPYVNVLELNIALDTM